MRNGIRQAICCVLHRWMRPPGPPGRQTPNLQDELPVRCLCTRPRPARRPCVARSLCLSKSAALLCADGHLRVQGQGSRSTSMMASGFLTDRCQHTAHRTASRPPYPLLHAIACQTVLFFFASCRPRGELTARVILFPFPQNHCVRLLPGSDQRPPVGKEDDVVCILRACVCGCVYVCLSLPCMGCSLSLT